jgi:uncharacterized protein YjiS (DUF1127 family)
MNASLTHSHTGAVRDLARPLTHLTGAIGTLLALWRQRNRDRNDLATLEALGDPAIRDAGFDRGSLAYEISKPFWRA